MIKMRLNRCMLATAAVIAALTLVLVCGVDAESLRDKKMKKRAFSHLLDLQWEEFKLKYNKTYELEEDLHRKMVFLANYMKIKIHNIAAFRGRYKYFLRINHLADKTSHEFRKMNGFDMRRAQPATVNDAMPYTRTAHRLSAVRLPDFVDWRKKGVVTEVKNQGDCGSCWAFSTTGSLEGQHALQSGRLVSLSEQNLVDCSKKYGNDGCDGGLMTNAFRYVKDNHGIDTEMSYPYEGHVDRCHFMKTEIGATDVGYVSIPHGDVDALQEAVANIGPISVAIDASSSKFQFYSHGVYHDHKCSSENLDHGVLVVGYGTEDGEPYWLIKNSWDTTWGLDGYIKMRRGDDNMCGVASQASYPVV